MDKLRAVPSDDASFSCLTGKALAELQAAKTELPAEEFKALVLTNLPTAVSLYRTTLSPEGNAAVLLIAAGEPPYAAGIEAQMEMLDGEWRIADSNNGGFNGDFVRPAQPASVTLSFDGAVDWEDRFLTFEPMGPQGCDIVIRHIFLEAALRIEADCEIANAPASHALPLTRADGSPARIDAIVPGIDAASSNGAGKLIITAAGGGLVTGQFEYEMWFESGDMVTARGAFENIPYREE